jgi:hypothetical protein
MKPSSLVAAAHEILLRDWDPIGVSDVAPPDEYDSYIGGVVQLIAEKASAERIAQHLRGIVKTWMLIEGDEKRTRAAAKKLAALAATD